MGLHRREVLVKNGHFLHQELVTERVRVALAGVGGNGAQMLHCLVRLDRAMRELGHPQGLYVTAFDPDCVSETNIGRQIWFPADVGENKAIVAVERINLAYGLDWMAIPARYDPNVHRDWSQCDILISCVDTRSARVQFHRYIGQGLGPAHYWLDLGNEEHVGNCVLGEIPQSGHDHNSAQRLPMVTELFTDLLDQRAPERNTPSCSLRISLLSQGLFINDVTARFAAQMLYRLFTKGQIQHHGALINLDSMRVNPIPVDPVVWQRYGFGIDKKAA
jgi:PRTRC genetic system ThiF family protein